MRYNSVSAAVTTVCGVWSGVVWAGAAVVVCLLHFHHQSAWDKATGVLQQTALGGQHVAWIAFAMAVAYALHQIGRAVADAVKGASGVR
jgi:hypothetical protein